MVISFVMSPVKSTGTAVTCTECGAVIADWIYAGFERTSDRSNQELHEAWHKKIVNDIALAATAHLRGNKVEPLDYCLGCGNEVRPEDARGDQTCGDMECIENVRSRL